MKRFTCAQPELGGIAAPQPQPCCSRQRALTSWWRVLPTLPLGWSLQTTGRRRRRVWQRRQPLQSRPALHLAAARGTPSVPEPPALPAVHCPMPLARPDAAQQAMHRAAGWMTPLSGRRRCTIMFCGQRGSCSAWCAVGADAVVGRPAELRSGSGRPHCLRHASQALFDARMHEPNPHPLPCCRRWWLLAAWGTLCAALLTCGRA